METQVRRDAAESLLTSSTHGITEISEVRWICKQFPPEVIMTKETEPDSLAHHLGHLAADADDLAEFLTREHNASGDIHPEALGKSERLATSLRDIIHALTKHEHLAMGPDDVWRALNVKHGKHDGGAIT